MSAKLEKLLTIPEAAKRLGIGESKARRAVACGDLAVLRYGHRTVRVTEAAMKAYMKQAANAKP
jgi:excisionase family DNA binding protein